MTIGTPGSEGPRAAGGQRAPWWARVVSALALLFVAGAAVWLLGVAAWLATRGVQ